MARVPCSYFFLSFILSRTRPLSIYTWTRTHLRVTCIRSIRTSQVNGAACPLSTVNLHPTTAACLVQGPALGLAPCEPLCAPTAHRDGCRRERGDADGEAAQPLRRAHHVRVRLELKLDITSGGACALAFARCGGTQSIGGKEIITAVYTPVRSAFLLL